MHLGRLRKSLEGEMILWSSWLLLYKIDRMIMNELKILLGAYVVERDRKQ